MRLALIDAVKCDEDRAIQEVVPFGQMLDFFGFGSAPHS